MARTSRDDRAAERLCGAIRDINTALQLLEGECGEPAIPKIRAIGELAPNAACERAKCNGDTSSASAPRR